MSSYLNNHIIGLILCLVGVVSVFIGIYGSFDEFVDMFSSFNDQIKYPGERILYKNENIKYEDSNNNKHYEANVFYTNFRVLCLTGNTAIDIPYNFISSHTTKTPIFTGRKYIQIDFKQDISFLLSYVYKRKLYSRTNTIITLCFS